MLCHHPTIGAGIVEDMLVALIALVVVLFIVLPLAGMALWALVSTAIVGLIIGALARLVVPGTRGMGLLPTLLLGWIGSIVGGFIGNHILHIGLLTVLLEIALAAILVAVYTASNRNSVTGGRRPSLRR